MSRNHVFRNGVGSRGVCPQDAGRRTQDAGRRTEPPVLAVCDPWTPVRPAACPERALDSWLWVLAGEAFLLSPPEEQEGFTGVDRARPAPPSTASRPVSA